MSPPNQRKATRSDVRADLWPWLDAVVEQDGLQKADANDVVAIARAKVVEVLLDVESGRRKEPHNWSAYLK